MRGHEALIALRSKGKAPRLVWLFCGVDQSESWKHWHHEMSQAHIEISPGDSVARLDLRFVVGLTVMVDGFDAARVAEVEAACLKAGAKRVMGAVVPAGEFEPCTLTDSEGVYVRG